MVAVAVVVVAVVVAAVVVVVAVVAVVAVVVVAGVDIGGLNLDFPPACCGPIQMGQDSGSSITTFSYRTSVMLPFTPAARNLM